MSFLYYYFNIFYLLNNIFFVHQSNTSSGSLYEQRVRKENLRKELEEMQNDIR